MRNGNKLMPLRTLLFFKILIINRLRFQTVRDELLGNPFIHPVIPDAVIPDSTGDLCHPERSPYGEVERAKLRDLSTVALGRDDN